LWPIIELLADLFFTVNQSRHTQRQKVQSVLLVYDTCLNVNHGNFNMHVRRILLPEEVLNTTESATED
jgi:hypothetical protein